MTPQLSTPLPSFRAEDPGGWEHLRRRAIIADRAGVDRVVCSDHVVFGENLEAYGDPKKGGQAGARQPTGPDGHWLDPFTVLAWVAGQTERVRLGTSIMIAALRRPVVLAKELATLDVLSGGRVDLGVGVGWQKEEYDAAGLDYSRRGTLLDHTLAVMQRLWREQRASYDDELLTFDAIHQMPKPRQPGGVPIWVSGTLNDNVLRRLARFGSGWIPWGDAATDLPSSIKVIKQALRDAGREDAGELQVMGFLPKADGVMDAARTAELVDAGVTDLRTTFRWTGDDDADLENVRGVVEAFRSRFGG